jgi:starch synthase
LKLGIVFADNLSTVSHSYAKDIQTPEHGHRLEGLFKERKEQLFGVVNGVDYSIWNPQCDAYIPYRYTDIDLSGKHFCKHALQKQFNLPFSSNPLIIMISRLDQYKGIQLIQEVLPSLLQDFPIQFILLGKGERSYMQFFQELRDRFPEQVAVYLSYNEILAHHLEAGADMYLMPSYTEPCGLNQLYSMKYGTVPIVRHTGGLADTVVDCTPQTLADTTASGFSFKDFEPKALYQTIQRAIIAYKDAILWNRLQYLCMQKNWSWDRSAREYVDLYHITLPK